MPSQFERRSATRQRLLQAALTCFVADGYEQASTERIRELAGVSRGAMYHHFPTKRALFEAVFTQVSGDAIRRALRVGRSGRAARSPLEDLVHACLAWLREVRHPPTAAIVVDQGPRVLGWRRAMELESETSLALLTSALAGAAQAGEIAVASVPLTARLLNAMLAEAALAAAGKGPAVSMTDLEHALRQFIGGLAPHRSPMRRHG